jgi:hypothetical protein
MVLSNRGWGAVEPENPVQTDVSSKVCLNHSERRRTDREKGLFSEIAAPLTTCEFIYRFYELMI